MKSVYLKVLASVLALLMVMTAVSACTPIEVPSEISGESSELSASESGEESSKQGTGEDSSDVGTESTADTSVSESSEVSVETTESEDGSEAVSEDSSVEDSSVEVSEPESSDSVSDESSESEYSAPDINTGEFFPPAEGKAVAFTFDDGPSYITDKILDYCEEKGIKVTFFVVGNRVGPENGARIQRAVSLGCEVGNHSYDHPSYTSMSSSAVLNDQIGRTNSIIEKYAGACPTLMRPPYGNYTKDLAAKAGMNVIMWSVDTLDWSYRNTEKIVEHSYSKIDSGDIILMHDLYETTYEAFVIMADKLIAEGYQLVTVSELLGSEKLVDKTFYFGFGY